MPGLHLRVRAQRRYVALLPALAAVFTWESSTIIWRLVYYENMPFRLLTLV